MKKKVLTASLIVGIIMFLSCWWVHRGTVMLLGIILGGIISVLSGIELGFMGEEKQ